MLKSIYTTQWLYNVKSCPCRCFSSVQSEDVDSSQNVIVDLLKDRDKMEVKYLIICNIVISPLYSHHLAGC